MKKCKKFLQKFIVASLVAAFFLILAEQVDGDGDLFFGFLSMLCAGLSAHYIMRYSLCLDRKDL